MYTYIHKQIYVYVYIHIVPDIFSTPVLASAGSRQAAC